MDPAEVESVIARFAAEATDLLRPRAIWAHGSLALGDFQPGRSDLDLVAVLAEPLTIQQASSLIALHERLLRDEPAAAKLHCTYVALAEIADAETPHYTFAHSRHLQRPVSPVTRRELLSAGRVLAGAEPTELLPPVSDSELAAYIRHMLRTYYLAVVTKSPSTWFSDTWIDQITLAYARAAVTLREGRLITKAAAAYRSAWSTTSATDATASRTGQPWPGGYDVP
ncbi:nucleotidyltransferase domain-containing protein [Actinospica durhamensis]|uniref:Nucleotidyltransferase domain-containing protein n=1 Tax=Actinospica durhamensis TaxID=1508375 RepID=A0A941F0T5_9ACTN|nr:nucleotidyltransferase domain-containing protein [Actinospica durhamensis]MBR7839604.1 nucleotidyltransferase domain-containing protein [Actinospica durhamensis]